jgi:hypothetical protein
MCRGNSLCQVPIALHCTLVRSPPPSLPQTPSQPHLKRLQEVSSFYFMYMKPINHIPSPSSPPFTFPQVPPHTLYLFYSHFFSYHLAWQPKCPCFPHCLTKTCPRELKNMKQFGQIGAVKIFT